MKRSRASRSRVIPVDTGGLNQVCRNIADLLDLSAGRNPPRVLSDTPIDRVVEELIRHPHSQRVYVVDDANRLLGTISVRTLTRHVFSHGQEPRVHSGRLLSALTSEIAEHLMQKAKVVVDVRDDLAHVIKALLDHHSAEAAVVDLDGKLVGDLTLLDLLTFCRVNPNRRDTEPPVEEG